jgi:hypothetical protein
MAQLRAGRGQLSLCSYSAWGGVGAIVSLYLAPIRKRRAFLTTMIREGFDLKK